MTKKIQKEPETFHPIPRRVKVVPVAHTIFENIFQEGYQPDYEVTKGLPRDAQLVGIRHDTFMGAVHMLFSSKEFDEVEEGTMPPVLEIELLSLPKANTL
jgi:hypothetical protein